MSVSVKRYKSSQYRHPPDVASPSTAAMKKQMEQQQVEYQRLADELAAAKGQSPSTKSD